MLSVYKFGVSERDPELSVAEEEAVWCGRPEPDPGGPSGSRKECWAYARGDGTHPYKL